MGAFSRIKENFKNNSVIKMLYESYSLIVKMVNFEGEEDMTIEKAIEVTRKNDPLEAEELKKVEEALKYQEEKSNEEIIKRFGDFSENEKDEDGYNKLPNKLKGIEEKVSEEKAREETKIREKNGKEKTRVEEE
jgi:hypothetical protein